MSFFDKLKQGLKKTKNAIFKPFADLLKSIKGVDEDLLEELEEILVCADVGTTTTEMILEQLRKEIDEYNILNASMLAMRRAVEKLEVKADFALIDGNCSRGFTIPTETVVKGDSKSASIAAASILAKVTRDRGCEELDRLYPMYGIAKNKGYGTAVHINAIKEKGLCPIHRRSFTKKF